jgi:hypothetical protein
MAKSKYRLGQLLRTESGLGEVTGVLQTTSGTEYMLEGSSGTVHESAIRAAYREVKPRTPKAQKPVARSRANGKAEARA